ncbi:tRNA (cytidine/uridine-2'-O-)-methyltransferase [Wenyingzhuangia heitensis]|uniref:Putative tRNA (cytidine(34)-2'-O)-methyltransferase n=1 Tax=Wenyingzhuangia heitensis TaxID=1487859 RepID=A0ABX0UAL7_9FLAO|nr:tRNA (cytidine(34)-2'-O)-methyltransferase [Wenyingzhuangia heitensis]NIJ44990.1 tRNA (cytidine/uridine-2'-O-)-methyltransferase [Wenyingzhuangia heitensis]
MGVNRFGLNSTVINKKALLTTLKELFYLKEYIVEEKTYLNIVLVHPQIPNNTGNIGRLCVGCHAKLHLVKPLGFEISDSRVKRAGLDYWKDLDITIHESFDDLTKLISNKERMFLLSARASTSIYETKFKNGDWLFFGKEAKGLSAEIQEEYKNQLRTIPFPGPIRSFNLGNAVAMVLGECLRQLT